MSETFRWATVKSALPVDRIETAVERRLLVTMPIVTTVITPTATATAERPTRMRRARKLRSMRLRKDMSPEADRGVRFLGGDERLLADRHQARRLLRARNAVRSERPDDHGKVCDDAAV